MGAGTLGGKTGWSGILDGKTDLGCTIIKLDRCLNVYEDLKMKSAFLCETLFPSLAKKSG